MGTQVQMIAYSGPRLDEAGTRVALAKAFEHMTELEQRLSEWRADSDVSRVNAAAGRPVRVGSETLVVVERALRAGRRFDGVFDITFQGMSDLWRFGDAAEPVPKVPDPKTVAARLAKVDYRKVQVDAKSGTVRIGAEQQIGLGGVAKGYIVDQAVAVLRAAGLRNFLVQAGGDLYGAGTKPDGSPWVSGVQDPRGPKGKFFAVLELTDHAFSTAGDYARAYVSGGKRYHHIIDPRTGYPATASRSVTVWAPDAITADVVDDAVFILGPERGLPLIESMPGVGAVIVDRDNRVIVSERLRGKVRILSSPTDGL